LTNLDLLRKQLCRQRLNVPAASREAASAAIAARIRHLDAFRQARHVAVYSAIRGEIDLQPLWHAELAAKHWYLPVIHPGSERLMQFVRHEPAAILRRNRYGIPEPDTANAVVRDPRELDLVLTPLVAFDSSGNRVGMGAGYYDRAFSFISVTAPPPRPKLIGIGYDFQHVEAIEPRPWDVPLWGVVTDEAVYGHLKEEGSN
jgi:5-formyltetrahydrofolate cyclo-ligase